MQVALRLVEKHQFPGFDVCYLARQFGADRPSRSRDQNNLALEFLPDPPEIHLYGRPSEKIFHPHVADVADGNGTIDDISVRRQCLEIDFAGPALVDDSLYLLACGRRHSDENVSDVIFLYDSGQMLAGSQNFDPLKLHPLFGWIVIDEPNRVVFHLPIAPELTNYSAAGAARSDDKSVRIGQVYSS